MICQTSWPQHRTKATIHALWIIWRFQATLSPVHDVVLHVYVCMPCFGLDLFVLGVCLEMTVQSQHGGFVVSKQDGQPCSATQRPQVWSHQAKLSKIWFSIPRTCTPHTCRTFAPWPRDLERLMLVDLGGSEKLRAEHRHAQGNRH